MDRQTRRDIALVCLADAVVGASFGAITVSGGLSPWLAIGMSLLVFAGGAQFAAVGIALAGGSAAAGVIAGLVLNTRLLPFGYAVADVVEGPWWKRAIGAHLITDESVAFTLRQKEADGRHAVFWLCGIALFLAWNVSVVLGVLAGGVIADPGVLGLDAAFPAVLLALVLPSLGAGIRAAAVLGAAIALATTPFLPPGVPVLLAVLGLVLARRAPRPSARES